MKQFISFVRKEFYHIFRDRRTMLILLGMPVVQIILFGFAITTEVKNVKVAVLDFSKDVSTRQIIDKLDASDYFNVNKMLYDNDEIEETLRKAVQTWSLCLRPVSITICGIPVKPEYN